MSRAATTRITGNFDHMRVEQNTASQSVEIRYSRPLSSIRSTGKG